jgi:hypothetical protein
MQPRGKAKTGSAKITGVGALPGKHPAAKTATGRLVAAGCYKKKKLNLL